MHSVRRADFANDNHPLTACDRDAICVALSLPDARTIRAALREKLAAIRLRARPSRPYKPAIKAACLGNLLAFALPVRITPATGDLAEV